MSNEQAAVLIRSYIEALRVAVDESIKLLPPEAIQKVKSSIYLDNKTIDIYPALRPFDTVLEHMVEDVSILLTGKSM